MSDVLEPTVGYRYEHVNQRGSYVVVVEVRDAGEASLAVQPDTVILILHKAEVCAAFGD
jgi:hypothetical protein